MPVNIAYTFFFAMLKIGVTQLSLQLVDFVQLTDYAAKIQLTVIIEFQVTPKKIIQAKIHHQSPAQTTTGNFQKKCFLVALFPVPRRCGHIYTPVRWIQAISASNWDYPANDRQFAPVALQSYIASYCFDIRVDIAI
jgi:hypothetical protein